MDLKPAMGTTQIAFLKESIKAGTLYLEFGMGGSTVIACQSQAAAIYSLDNSLEWVTRCREHPSIAKRMKNGTAKLYFADVGRVGRWGKPSRLQNRIDWPCYSIGIWSEMPALPDVVFIDGRWRVACALQALWRCEDWTRILVHDWDKREKYHELLEFADIAEKVGSLVCLAPKPERDRGLIAMRALERVSDYS